MRLWCYACGHRSSVANLTANNLFQLGGQNPYVATLGEMGYISNLCPFGWYEWVYFCQNTASLPYQKEELGRCLGPTKNEGNEMCQWIIQQNGQIVPRQTIRRLITEERSAINEVEANKRASFYAAIKEYVVDLITPAPLKPTQISIDPLPPGVLIRQQLEQHPQLTLQMMWTILWLKLLMHP